MKSELALTFYIAKGHQYVSENVIKIGGHFGAIFWKNPCTIVQGFFPKFGVFKK